ncbi:MAG TPA: Gfo/Idh/MocA family oxidoreductase [Vicinamibacterales bacterium]|nr:Gfo/Idh/MocA family oxidoreductase [Vicinamibacterales bacterium]
MTATTPIKQEAARERSGPMGSPRASAPGGVQGAPPIKKVRWGVLGVARIATAHVIPAMQEGEWSTIAAIASRDAAKARDAAAALGVPKAYGSYEALLNDPDIEAIYNPLPNHLHLPWSIRALEAGKHVLCEKPIGLNAGEARELLAARDRADRLVQEAFMVHTHPQWLRAREMVRQGRIGELRSIAGYFSYFNRDAANIRNIPDFGGGALMDIGCYLIHTSRMIFESDPRRVMALIDRDPDMKIDRMTSILMEFDRGHSIGTCSTQVAAYQRMHLIGTEGRIEIEIPFNAPADRPCRVFVDDGTDLSGAGIETIAIDQCNQYTIQGDLFSRAVRENRPAPYPLEDTIANMTVMESVLRSAEKGRAESVD